MFVEGKINPNASDSYRENRLEMQPSQIPRYFRSTEAHSSQNESFLEPPFLVKIVPSLPV